MKNNLFKSIVLTMLVVFVSTINFVGCNNEVTPSFYTGYGDALETPEITSVEPSSEAIAAITEITITGKNFSTDISKDYVYFGGQLATILSATPTQLKVIAANVTNDKNINIRIATQTAVSFSNSYAYLLTPAAKEYFPLPTDSTLAPYNLYIDKSDNIYSYITSVGVYQITPDSVATLYSVKSGESFWSSMRFGSDGVLYGVRGIQAIFSVPAGGGVKNSVWLAMSPSTIKISKIDIDPLGNMWAGGKNAAIYRIKSDKSYVSFPFDYNITAMRVFVDNGTTYLYVAIQKDNSTSIMRMPIDANGDLGTAETYFDFSGNYGTEYTINDIVFAADGTLYLATNLPSPIVCINTDKTHSFLYEGLILNSPALALAWGNGNYMYYIRTRMNDATGACIKAQAILKLNMLKPGAPYYEF